MPVVEHISIHHSPMTLFKYVVNGDKTAEMKYVSAWNCSENIEDAYDEFRSVFEYHAGERFYKKSDTYETGKNRVLLHHYIQSFAPGETDAETANKIGMDWARQTFGMDHQFIVSTHIDKNHIHNHIILNPYSLSGKHWIDNQTTLKTCRDKSDEIARRYGLSVIENPKNEHNHKYAEWIARKNNDSWKEKICDNIDRLILMDSVKNIDDLVSELRKIGYIVRHKKYISIKPADQKDRKPIRSKRLGDGYGLEELQYRIENKNQEMSLAAVMKYEGIQREYAMCLRELQIILYRKPDYPKRVTYTEVRKNSELLCYLSDNNIHSKEDFEKVVNAAAEKADEMKKSVEKIKSDIEDKEKISADGNKYVELNSILLPTNDIARELKKYEYLDKFELFSHQDVEKHRRALVRLKEELPKAEDELKAAETEKKNAAQLYKTFLRQMQTDYEFIFEKMKRDKEEQEKQARGFEEQRRTEQERISRQTRRKSQDGYGAI